MNLFSIRPPPECRVEVDEVKPVRALALERPRDLDRIGVERRDGVPLPLQQAHDAAAPEVDRGPEGEAARVRRAHAASSSRKLERRSRPVSEDFSGWNWQPHTFAFWTIAGKPPP